VTRVNGNCTVTQRIKKSWFISREDLNLLTINTQQNTGLCHYVISVRNTSVVAINMLILAIDGSWKLWNQSSVNFIPTVAECASRHAQCLLESQKQVKIRQKKQHPVRVITHLMAAAQKLSTFCWWNPLYTPSRNHVTNALLSWTNK